MLERNHLLWSELAKLPVGASIVDDLDGARGWVDVHEADRMKYIQWADGRFSAPLCGGEEQTTVRAEE